MSNIIGDCDLKYMKLIEWFIQIDTMYSVKNMTIYRIFCAENLLTNKVHLLSA
jgi:hypothetical protein